MDYSLMIKSFSLGLTNQIILSCVVNNINLDDTNSRIIFLGSALSGIVAGSYLYK